MPKAKQSSTKKQRHANHLQQLVECLVDFAFHVALSTHRGALATNGMTFVFGNDGYEESPEAQREVELLREALAAEEIQEIAFATEIEEAYSWGMLLEGDHADWVNDKLWSIWEEACREAGGDE
jgi:hypothetical protein